MSLYRDRLRHTFKIKYLCLHRLRLVQAFFLGPSRVRKEADRDQAIHYIPMKKSGCHSYPLFLRSTERPAPAIRIALLFHNQKLNRILF